jgi:hypothetical protein
LAAPIGDVEGSVGKEEIGLEIGMTVVVKSAAVGNVAIDTMLGLYSKLGVGGISF